MPSIFSEKKIVKTSIKVDILDIVLNGLAAFITGSVVMLVETLQGFSELISSVFTYIGVRRSQKIPTKKYPLGYGRELYLWSLFSTLIMFLGLAILSFYFGFRRFNNPEPVSHIFLAYIILVISFFTNGYSLSLAFRRILQKEPFWKIKKCISQSTFLETKIIFTLELLGTLAALLGLMALILFQKTGNLKFDGLGAMTIGVLMSLFSFWLLKNIKDFIVGVSAPEETQEEIKKAALEIDNVKEILDYKVLVIGSNKLLINLEVHIEPGIVTEEIEKIIDKIKENIKEKIPSAYHIQIELETPNNK